MKKILFVAPYPDDETLGCGGTILKHRAIGDKVYWLIMTNILPEDKYYKKRQLEIASVSKKYKFEKVFKLDLPTTKLDAIPKAEIITKISAVINKVKPDRIYIPNRNDVHSDHQVTFDVVISSTKTFRCAFIKKILMYETISETEFAPSFQNKAFVPNSFSDITNYIDKKLSIAEIYKTEIGAPPFPRSIDNIKALATLRGATANVKFAEAFVVLKEIW